MALVLYGIIGILVSVVLLVVGSTTMGQIGTLQNTLEGERSSLVASIRAASKTLADTGTATNDFQTSISGARDSADTASKLANDTAGTFRDMAGNLNISIFGIQPLAGLAPQFERGADQLQLLAISLGATREALAVNRTDIQRVATDLSQLQRELDAVARSLEQPNVLGLGNQSLTPFKFAFYGACLLVILQSVFSIVAGLALHRLQAAMGSAPLFPFLGPTQPALPPPTDFKMATTSGASGDGRDRARA